MDFLVAFFTLILVLGTAFWIKQKVLISAGHALMLTVSAQVVIAFIFGLLGGLYVGTILILAASFLFSLLLLRDFVRGRGDRSLPVSLGLPLLLSIVFWAFHQHSQFVHYDEYAHWGVFLKDMLALDRFWDSTTNAMHTRYPPGSPLWQYIVLRFDEFSDGRAYLAHFVLLISPIMILFEKVSWKQYGWIGGILLFLVIVVSNYSNGIGSLYVDHLIGLWFAGTMLCYITLKDKTVKNILTFVFPICLLALLKDSGLFFSIAAAMTIVLAESVRRYIAGKWSRSESIKLLSLAILLVSVPASSVYAWNLNRNLTGHAKDIMSSEGIIKGLLEDKSDLDAVTREKIAKRFKKVFFDQQLAKNKQSLGFHEFSYNIKHIYKDHFRLTTYSFILLWPILYFAMVWRVSSGPGRLTWSVTSLGVYLTALVYIYLLYLSYEFAFGIDGLRIPSYLRYVHSIILPLLILGFAPLLPLLGKNSDDKRVTVNGQKKKAIYFGILLFAFMLFEPPLFQSLMPHYLKTDTRDLFSSYTGKIKKVVGTDSVWIYLSSAFPNAADRLMMFLFSPTPVHIEKKADYFDNSTDFLAQDLKGYTYLWAPPFVHGHEGAIKQLVGDEKLSTGGLYKITLTQSKKLKFIPIDIAE